MFISKLEKQEINESIIILQMKVSSLQNDVLFLTGKLKALQGKEKEPVKTKKNPRTEEQKMKQAAYVREWHSRNRQRKQEAAALAANAELRAA